MNESALGFSTLDVKHLARDISHSLWSETCVRLSPQETLVSELIDNRRQRISILKEIIQHLHAGAAPELVKKQLREIVRQTDGSEIMAMEQQLMAEGMSVEQVRSVCDLHSKSLATFSYNCRRLPPFRQAILWTPSGVKTPLSKR